jgi:CBS domain-containing protein
LGNLVGENSGTHKNEIDLKAAVAVYFVDLIRILSMKGSIPLVNTLDRLAVLKEKGILSTPLTESLVKAYQTVMSLRINSNLYQLKSGATPDNYVNLNKMSLQEKKQLKEAVKSAETLMAIVREEYVHI